MSSVACKQVPCPRPLCAAHAPLPSTAQVLCQARVLACGSQQNKMFSMETIFVGIKDENEGHNRPVVRKCEQKKERPGSHQGPSSPDRGGAGPDVGLGSLIP